MSFLSALVMVGWSVFVGWLAYFINAGHGWEITLLFLIPLWVASAFIGVALAAIEELYGS